MTTIRALTVLISLPMLFTGHSAGASDLAKEKRWAEQVTDALFDGEAIWLQAGKTRVLGIYTPSATQPPKGAVILAHGTGVHPDWPDVINPLRVALPKHGWTTLSVQMPILANDAKEDAYPPLFPEIAPRMDAAFAYLRAKGIKTIFVAGHSMGTSMSAYYLANHPSSSKGLVAVGTSGTGFTRSGEGKRYFDSLPKLSKLPVLDIYGSDDEEAVLSTVARRMEIAQKSGNKRYVQVKVNGANHFFRDKNKELVDEVSRWLDANAKK